MGEILQINKDLKVYHLSYGWGVVTSCEPGEPFQVKFPHRDEVYSFYRDGSEILNGKQVVFNNDVVVTEKPNSDKDIYSFTTFVTQDGDVVPSSFANLQTCAFEVVNTLYTFPHSFDWA